jgi:hypothetical protein
MWIQLEGKPNPAKFLLEENDFETYDEFKNADLDDFKIVLIGHYSALHNVVKDDIELFDESFSPLDPSTDLSSLYKQNKNNCSLPDLNCKQ